MTITREVDLNEIIYTLEVELTEVSPYRPKTFDRPAEGPEYWLGPDPPRCTHMQPRSLHSAVPPQPIAEKLQVAYGVAVWGCLDEDEHGKFYEQAYDSQRAA